MDSITRTIKQNKKKTDIVKVINQNVKKFINVQQFQMIILIGLIYNGKIHDGKYNDGKPSTGNGLISR